ncbi:hypothetical protein MCOR14_000560 [Pyricularia oryzae]|nr:hypothetical protein MCOR14_000560 [Pyricularia oryzae]
MAASAFSPENILLGFAGKSTMGRVTYAMQLVGIGVAIYWIILATYRLYFHPLAKFPGPRIRAITGMPYLYQSYVEGTFARKVRALHAEYGNVVRVAPNRLAVDGVVGWKDVHAVRAPSPEMPKLPGYYGPDSHRSLVASPTREGHQRHRRALAYGFSNTAMHEQEPVITYYVDMLIRQLSKRSKEGPLDMAMWFNFLSFDVVGDLAFADSFNILKKGKYHPWTSNLIKGIEGATLNRFFLFSSPLLAPLALLDLNGTIKTFWENRRIADSKTKARIDLGPDPPVQTDLIGRDGKPVVRKDFVGYMLRFNQKASNEALSEVEMKRNANIIMNAGSETTATALAVLTFMFSLPENRIWMERATEEVRATFKSEDEINLHSVSNHPLPILRACSEEALRFHPPAPDMPPRLCPGGTGGDYYVPKGAIIQISQLATYHNPDHFLECDDFRPQRFLPPDHPLYEKRFANDNFSVFKPFSYGNRDCMGKNLAYIEMRFVMCRILFRFDYLGLDYKGGANDQWLNEHRAFIVWKKPPLMVIFREREGLVPLEPPEDTDD